nr:hypothetical protein CFP56_69859 [Quercus suber]
MVVDDGNLGMDGGGACPAIEATDMRVADGSAVAVEAREHVAQARRPACGSSCRREKGREEWWPLYWPSGGRGVQAERLNLKGRLDMSR